MNEQRKSRGFWLSDKEYQRLKEKAKDYFGDRLPSKGLGSVYIQEIAEANAVYIIKGKSGKKLLVSHVEEE